MAPGSDKKSNIALEVLRRTPLDKLDETVEALKKHRPVTEVRGAIIELFAAAPFSDRGVIAQVFVKHFGDAGK
jgi:hypothetical protein